MDALSGLETELGMAIADFEQTHQMITTQSRQSVRRSLMNRNFRNGLALSSQSLSSNLSRYLERDLTQFGARDEQIERGILRYLTRTAMKATPFGTMCAIIPGRFVDAKHDDTAQQFVGNLQRCITRARANKQIYALLWAHLKRRPQVRRVLVLCLS
jgi:hypothetical protein